MANKDMVDSTGDARTANNAVRHQYRVLSDDERAQMQKIKDLGAALVEAIYEIGHGPGVAVAEDRRLESRDLELAREHAEDAVMRAVRHITA